MMIDNVLVELIDGRLALAGFQSQARSRNEPQQVAFPAAMGAVALVDFAELALDVESDPSAMAAS
jgi:hypothetical protein